MIPSSEHCWENLMRNLGKVPSTAKALSKYWLPRKNKTTTEKTKQRTNISHAVALRNKIMDFYN